MNSANAGGEHIRLGPISKSNKRLSWKGRVKWILPCVTIVWMVSISTKTLEQYRLYYSSTTRLDSTSAEEKWDRLSNWDQLSEKVSGDNDIENDDDNDNDIDSSVEDVSPRTLRETPTLKEKLDNASNEMRQHPSNRIIPAKTPLYTPKVRYLFGILTTGGKLEKTRRRVIRSTYLSFYNQQYVGYPQGLDNAICSIQELQQDFKSPQQHHKFKDCQIVYTFVAAAGDPHSAPTELMHHNHTHPFTLPSAPQHSNMSFWFNNERDDTTFLNIKENMNEGKSQTWFKYGAMVAAQLGIDYIAKLDSDAIVWPSCFLKHLQQKKVKKVLAPPSANNMSHRYHQDNMNASLYGGFSWNLACKPGQHEFYSGMFYFMSIDVAQDVTSDACPRHELLYSPSRLRKKKCPETTVQSRFLTRKSILIGAEDMSMGNFVAECSANHKPVRYLNVARPNYGNQGPTMAHPEWSVVNTKSAPLKEPRMFERYYHLRNLIVRTEQMNRDENKTEQMSGDKNTAMEPKMAICLDNSLFGSDINFFDIIEWVVYHRLLGFDQVIMSYIGPSCINKPGFEDLRRLPYVTIAENILSAVDIATADNAVLGVTKGSRVLAGACDRQCIIQNCLKTTGQKKYDWVWVASVGEYLWFNQTIGVKEFVSRHGQDHDMLSFGRYMYSPKHQQGNHGEDEGGAAAGPISGFWAEDYPFTAKTYCEKRTASGLIPDPCPMWPGRAKFMIRPIPFLGKFHNKLKVHGNVFADKPDGQFQVKSGERALHLPMEVAHMKQWSVNTRTIGPSRMVNKGEQLVIMPKDGRALGGWKFYSDSGTKNVTMFYDAGLKDWFKYVASRGPHPDFCSRLIPSTRPPKLIPTTKPPLRDIVTASQAQFEGLTTTVNGRSGPPSESRL